MIYTAMFLLAVLAIGHAVWPLWMGSESVAADQDSSAAQPRRSLLLRQMQELEFDYASGKLTRGEYDVLLVEMQSQLDSIKSQGKVDT
jgi:flagellar basal body-associated protein FliL